MEKKNLYTDLTHLLHTDEDVFQLTDQLQAVAKDIYKNDVSLDTVLSADLGSRFFDYIQQLLHQSGVNLADRDKVRELFDSIILEIRSFSVIHITFAFDPTPLLLGEIVAWCRSSITEQSILAVSIDKSIIGGFLMDYTGHYWDFSVRSSLDKLFGGGNLIYLVQRNMKN